MFKDYYKILGIPETANAEDIKSAYRKQALKWHPDLNPDKDTSEQMKDVNEAYSILSDDAARARYDREYQVYRYTGNQKNTRKSSSSEENDYDIQDDKLKEDIKNAQKAAEEFVKEFYSSLKKDSAKAAKGAWDSAKPYLIVGVIMTAIGLIFAASHSSSGVNYSSTEPEVQLPEMTKQDTPLPEGWTTYTAGNSFQISVPHTVELRNDDDEYTQTLKRLSLTNNNDNIIFQQKGLSRREPSALDRYCRVMIQYIKGMPGDFMTASETETLDSEWKSAFDELVEGCIGPAASLMGTYTYKWATVNGAKCIQIDYRRTGNNFDTSIPVVCRIAIFQNDNEMVKLILSYREKESDMWKAEFEQLFKSFKWI